jgi:FKBP-type peptidyl-prolyl cis-trans isomerase
MSCFWADAAARLTPYRMNMKTAFLSGLVVCSAAAVASAQDPAPAAPAPAITVPGVTPAAPTFTNAQLTEEFGWWIAKRLALTEVQFTPDEAQGLIKGLSAALQGKEAPYDLEKAGPAMDALMNGKQSNALSAMKGKNAAAAVAFFAKLKAENKNVQFTPSGLAYEIVQPGQGPFPGPADTVKVQYTGKLVDGTVFDSSVHRGPAEFALNGVIPGWTEGIQKVNKGGKIRLYVPAALGYGDSGSQGIPPASTLIFDVELLDIKPAPAAAPSPAMPGSAPAGGAAAPSAAPSP